MKSGWNLSVCGLNCAACDMYLAGHGDEKLRQEIVDWLKTKRNRTVEPENIRCEGCRGPLDAHWSADCKMRQCAAKKKVKCCFQCTDFPCKILNAFASDGVDHHRRTVENLKRMKEAGLEAWIAEQDKKGGPPTFCP